MSVCSDCRENCLNLPAPINTTLPKKKKNGMINQSVTFKILPLSSKWQHGLPLTPVTWRPAHLHFTFYDWKCLKNRKCSQGSAHRALFFLSLLRWRCRLFVKRAGSIFSLCLLQSNRQLSVPTNWVQALTQWMRSGKQEGNRIPNKRHEGGVCVTCITGMSLV